MDQQGRLSWHVSTIQIGTDNIMQTAYVQEDTLFSVRSVMTLPIAYYYTVETCFEN